MKTLTNEGSEIISLIQRNGNWRDKHMAYVLKKIQLQFYIFTKYIEYVILNYVNTFVRENVLKSRFRVTSLIPAKL